MNEYMPVDKQNQAEDTMGPEYDFKTIEEAEEYYFSHFAATNNMHDEETAKLERWLESQSIEELENEEDMVEVIMSPTDMEKWRVK